MEIKVAVFISVFLLMISGFAYLGASSAANTSDDITTVYKDVASVNPIFDKAIKDWADNQRIDDVQTLEELEHLLKDRKAAKQILGMLNEKVLQVKQQYPKYDPELLAVLYGGQKQVNVIVYYNNRDNLNDILNTVKTNSNVEVRYVYQGIDAIALRNVSIGTLKQLDNDSRITYLYLTKIERLPEPRTADIQQSTVSDWDIVHINAEPLWNMGYRGEGINISIIDTGIDATHPDLNDLDDNPATNDPKVILQTSFVSGEGPADGYGHGTHVAGIAAGTGQASSGQYMGVAPKAWLFNAKSLDSQGSGNDDDIMAAIEWSVNNGAKIISMSIGGGDNPTDGTSPLSQEVDWAVKRGVLVTVAAGNDGPRDDYTYLGVP